MNLRNALIDLTLENVIPKGDRSLSALGARNGLSSCGQKNCDLNEVKKFLTPKGGLILKLAYARLWNLNHVNQKNVTRFYLHRKDGLTSSCALGGRSYPGRSEACLTTLFSEFCHPKILGRDRQSCEERAARGLRLCDGASGLLQF